MFHLPPGFGIREQVMSALDAQTPEIEAPLPLAQFKRFLAVFHVVFLAGLALSLVLRWKRPELVWGWRDTTLGGIVLLQALLYVLFFVLLWKPPTAEPWWFAYFGASFAIWLIEWQLEPGLQWTALAYLGQLFGVLPPAQSVVLALGVFLTWFGVRFGTTGASFWESVGAISLAVTTTALGLFLHRLTVTSAERGKLITELEAARKQLEATRERDAELAALRERERLARDLHDSLGHGLVTLTVQLEAAQRLYPVDPQKAARTPGGDETADAHFHGATAPVAIGSPRARAGGPAAVHGPASTLRRIRTGGEAASRVPR